MNTDQFTAHAVKFQVRPGANVTLVSVRWMPGGGLYIHTKLYWEAGGLCIDYIIYIIIYIYIYLSNFVCVYIYIIIYVRKLELRLL